MSGQRANPPPCMAYVPELGNPYGYLPSIPAGVIFSILFGISAVIHLWQVIKCRRLWTALFVFGAGIECMGWIARTKSHDCPYSVPLFTMQTAVLIMAPAWTQAGIYVTLWVIINIIGRELSPVPAKIYLISCICIDVVCLTLQATGGGMAGAAFSKGTDTQTGTTIMVVGIIFQLVIAVIFTLVMTLVFYRGRSKIFTSRKVSSVAIATAVSITCMVIRGVYRSIELLEGWRGYLITTERYFIALDGTMMIIAVVVFNLAHPGFLLERTKHSEQTEKKRHSNWFGKRSKSSTVARPKLSNYGDSSDTQFEAGESPHP